MAVKMWLGEGVTNELVQAATVDTRRRPGRPRLEVDLEAVATAATTLMDSQGYDSVTIELVAAQLEISRASLYRAVPSKMHLLGLIFERGTRALSDAAREHLDTHDDPAEQLRGLIRLHTRTAITMRRYIPVFFDGAGLPDDVRQTWQKWSRYYESLWTRAVAAAIDHGILPRENVDVSTRLLLGMCIWVSRWYRPDEGLTEQQIAQTAIRMVGLDDE